MAGHLRTVIALMMERSLRDEQRASQACLGHLSALDGVMLQIGDCDNALNPQAHEIVRRGLAQTQIHRADLDRLSNIIAAEKRKRARYEIFTQLAKI